MARQLGADPMFAYFQNLMTQPLRVHMERPVQYPAGSPEAEMARLEGLRALGLLNDEQFAVRAQRYQQGDAATAQRGVRAKRQQRQAA